MGPPCTTAALSAELENTSNRHSQYALATEARALEYLLSKHLSLLYQRKKIAGVEIDFIMWCPDGSFGGHIVFVEVKSLRRVEMMAYRISPAQRQRLSVAKSFFESIYSLPVEVLAVYVSPNGEIQDLVLL